MRTEDNDMGRSVWRWLGFSLVALAGLTLLIAPMIASGMPADLVFTGVGFGVSVTMGGLIIGRRRGHATGWLVSLTGLAVVFANGFSAFPGVSSTVATWVESWSWTMVFALYAMLALTFPSGHTPRGNGIYSRLGRVAMWTLPVLVATAALTTVFGGPETFTATTNPVGFLPDWLGYVALFGTILILLGVVASLVVRRKSARGAVRAQLTWVVFPLVLLVTAIVLTFAYILGSVLLGFGDPGDSVWTPAFILMVLFPLAFAVAVLRYRLYEIDRIISRTVTYGLVVAVLAVVYAVGVYILRGLLPLQGDLAVAASTLLVAALFNPLRRRVQDRVDRRFNRVRYDAQREAEAFGDRLRASIDLTELTDDLVAVVARTVEPTVVSLWIRKD